MSKKILVATEKLFSPIAVKKIKDVVEKNGHELILLEKYTDKAQLLDAVKDVDALIVRSDKVDQEVLDAAKNLKIVVRAGAGYDNLDTTYAAKKSVVCENTPGQNSNAVAELVFGLAVMAVRNFYNGKSGGELKDRKLGIHGMGHVGQNVARIGNGFGMQVYSYRRSKEDEPGVTRLNSTEELYKTCDVISLHIPSNDKTAKSVNYELLKLLPEGAILVNSARKEVINEDDLLKIMNERPDIKFVTDLKPDKDEEFSKLEGRYFTTPKKMGAQTAEANINAGVAAAEQICRYFESGDETFRVN